MNILVADDFDTVAPGVKKIQETTWQDLDFQFFQSLTDGFLVIDDQTNVAPIIWCLRATLRKINELVTKINKGHFLALAAELEGEQFFIEGQCFIYITDFQGDMIEADNARFLFCH